MLSVRIQCFPPQRGGRCAVVLETPETRMMRVCWCRDRVAGGHDIEQKRNVHANTHLFGELFFIWMSLKVNSLSVMYSYVVTYIIHTGISSVHTYYYGILFLF